jgi:KTSC domain
MPSTAIRRIAYLAQDRELDVTFVGSGNTYTYIGVEPEVHEEFRRAPSKGRFFNTRIKDRYPFRRWGVTPEIRSLGPRSPGHAPARRVPH